MEIELKKLRQCICQDVFTSQPQTFNWAQRQCDTLLCIMPSSNIG